MGCNIKKQNGGSYECFYQLGRCRPRNKKRDCVMHSILHEFGKNNTFFLEGTVMDINLEYYKIFYYVAKYDGRSGSGQIMYLINNCIRTFEEKHGKISLTENED